MKENFHVLSEDDALLFKKLKVLFNEVKELTIEHKVLQDSAVVYPKDLGAALSRVNIEWYKTVLK